MKAYLSKEANIKLVEYLISNKVDLNFVKRDVVYKEVSSHPDIYMCQLGNQLFHGDTTALGYRYPGNIIYNGACTGKYFIHNLQYTHPNLLKVVKDMGMILIDVNQGYSKCNIVTVDENSIITSDKGIYSKCFEILDVLLIEEGHIHLSGFDYGFIGGTSGKYKDTILFNGDLSTHPDFNRISEFINKRNLQCKWFDDYPLTDIGSILFDFGGKV